MIRIYSRFMQIFFVSVTVAVITSAEAPAAENSPPAGARQLSAVELFQLFGDKTWVWDNGGAFFQSKTRKFKAYSNDDNDKTSADGRWIITNTGRLCLEAEWQNATGGYAEITCFKHMQSGRTIYQQKENNGDWYIFVDNGQIPKSLVSGDVISNEYSKTQKEILASRR